MPGFTTNDQIIQWLLDGDPAIQYQTHRDLLDNDITSLRSKISKEGWGKQLLDCRHADGHWGRGFYQPKWTSPHYTLLDLRNLNILPTREITETLHLIFEKERGRDGGINPAGSVRPSDICVNGMVLNYASYFGVAGELLKPVIDFLLKEKMADGGFNCRSNTTGAVPSSVHTTLSVLEGFTAYREKYPYRIDEVISSELDARESLLMHRLYRSDKTGNIINSNFLHFPYPGRWYYDILKALDYFQTAGAAYDERLDDALNFIRAKKTTDGQWKLSAKHPGLTHFEMEEAGKPGRWNTLRALRVLKFYNN